MKRLKILCLILFTLLSVVGCDQVIDFINIGIGPIRTGIFNIADLAVMIGVVMLVFLFAIRFIKRHRMSGTSTTG
jgi:lipoprotein signal peptidase